MKKKTRNIKMIPWKIKWWLNTWMNLKSLCTKMKKIIKKERNKGSEIRKFKNIPRKELVSIWETIMSISGWVHWMSRAQDKV